MIIEMCWRARVLALHSTRRGIVVLGVLEVPILASPRLILGFSRRLVPRLTLMLMMIPLAFLLALVETIWSHSALTAVN